jgi:hypothetical protein
MSDRDAVLFANEAFYRAFADRDLQAMEGVWAKSGPVTCIHPGWVALTTRQQVMASWARILSSDNAPKINCRKPDAFVVGEVAFVICYEEIAGDFLVATNIFRRERGRWLMIHHQAGPSAGPPEDEDEDDEEAPPPRAN